MVRGMRQENWLSSCVTKAVQVANIINGYIYIDLYKARNSQICRRTRNRLAYAPTHSVCRRTQALCRRMRRHIAPAPIGVKLRFRLKH
jgi:hypothetical protein